MPNEQKVLGTDYRLCAMIQERDRLKTTMRDVRQEIMSDPKVQERMSYISTLREKLSKVEDRISMESKMAGQLEMNFIQF